MHSQLCDLQRHSSASPDCPCLVSTAKPKHVWSAFQVLQPIVTAMATAEAAIPAREPYIVAEAAEGVAYHQLPTPKGAVLVSITATVADLNAKITTVSNAELCSI